MAAAIEVCQTQGTDEWLQAREDFIAKGGMTGSEAPALVKRGYESMRKIIRKRLGIEPELPPDLFKQQLFERGHDLEPFARQAMSEYLQTPIQETGFWVSTIFDGMGASPDGVGEQNGHSFVLECKAPLTTAITQEKFGRYTVQAAWQMMVLGCRLAWIVVYHPTEPIIAWFLKRNAFLEDILLREFLNFQQCLLDRTAPARTKEISDYLDWETREYENKWMSGLSFIKIPRPQQMASSFISASLIPVGLPPSCRCGKTKVERVVKKDGPNHGKRFWACPGSCEGTIEPIDEFVKLNDYAANRSKPVKRQMTEPPSFSSSSSTPDATTLHQEFQTKLDVLNGKLDNILTILKNGNQPGSI